MSVTFDTQRPTVRTSTATVADKPKTTAPATPAKPQPSYATRDTFEAAPKRAPVALLGDRTPGTPNVAANMLAGGGGTGPVQAGGGTTRTDTTDPTAPEPANIDNTGGINHDMELVERTVQMGGGSGEALADALNNPNLSGEEKLALVDRMMNDPNGLGIEFFNFDGAGIRNEAYDAQRAVGSAVGDAYRQGVITDAELKSFIERLEPPERRADFIATLASDPDNTGAGGVVEAAGKAAQAIGDESAAALAFSSSQALIDRNLTTPEAQRAAAEQVKAFVDERKDMVRSSSTLDGNVSMAAANLARLSANGNGLSDSELRDFFADLGPGMANEALARARVVPGDVAVGGAVDKMAHVFDDLSRTGDEDDRAQWKVNAAIANTSSDELIDANLDTPEERADAFHTLAAQANALYDEAKEASGQYNLLEYPSVMDGATRLMSRYGDELLDGALKNPDEYPAAAELTRFFENTLFSPYATSEQRSRVEDAINRYVDQSVDGVQFNGAEVGRDVGKLLALVQRGAQEAISRAGDDADQEKSLIGDLFKSVFTKVASTLATSAATALTGGNGIAGAIAGTATNALLTQLLGKEPDPATLRQDLENKFREMLAQEGTSTNIGERMINQLNDIYSAAKEDLNRQLARTDLTPAERERLEAAERDLQDTYLAINDGYEFYVDGDELSEALEKYPD